MTKKFIRVKLDNSDVNNNIQAKIDFVMFKNKLVKQ